ncbi:ribulose 1,5-bisphosphate carboxylase [Phaeovibrio sulfidiphilus]|uniref:Ribulose 1,5-bisphosphate carboxylase n=1 Tax=Phaeovibrio sulfidiphilus TaxID=1220600 RepID=A0A8J6YMU7_9PROT|nr:RuBisCO large subunit C-terminal-like domain-containing protein [Phaeovibrio sulfidiphilus]MBE1236221.1 ribulose 1,5-bisphosphate carboxylase [Phaeovibrio sulfidiphilus]
MSTPRISAVYHVRADDSTIEAQAKAIAVEQSVEMPLAAIDSDWVMENIVGRVESINRIGDGLFEVRVGLAVETTGLEAGQLINMLLGNTSIQDTVTLVDAEFPEAIFQAFRGPNLGIQGLRDACGAHGRAMTCSAIKPQGLSVAGLVQLAERFALGGPDYVKDDHGHADQAFSPFAERVPAIARAVARANASTGYRTRYVPNLNGNLDAMREQIRIARSEGIDTFMAPPMVCGFPTFHTLVRENPGCAFFSHPSMSGTPRIAPEFLHGKLFRLLGADAVIYTNYGGRFGFTKQTCQTLAHNATGAWGGLRGACPVPAGGMTQDRVAEMVDAYGQDVMLLIGGGLLLARENLTAETRAFVETVERLGAA